MRSRRHRRHRGRAPELVLLLGADEVAPERFAGAFKVYIGHHGDKGARQADLVLPGAAYAEKHGTYVNLEGRVQRGEKASFPPGEAREDWTIFRACPTCSASRCRSTASTSCARR
jgi:NADH-quinone oxidoreductase subunit G